MDVTPDKQNLDQLFGSTTFYIDFYQRQYKWTREPVEKLLDDVFYKFNDEYSRHCASDRKIDEVIDEYGWYYLNTIVTNKVSGKDYIVDGQQRLTTLSLILMKIMHLSQQCGSKLEKWISTRIAGLSGFEQNFWVNHESSKGTMEKLYSDGLIDDPQEDNITSRNLVENYRIVSNWIDKELPVTNLHRFESFVFYFMRRIVMIRLDVNQTDVPMIFEVINDRGVRLKPYEILKGKLLGQIDKVELEKLHLNDIWDSQVNRINQYQEDEIDQFFTYYLKAKYANTRGDGRKYDGPYHRAIMKIDDLGLSRNEQGVKKFLLNEFVYFTNLYERVLKYREEYYDDYCHVYYNKLTKMDSQFHLILSACVLNDIEEDEKIKVVSREVDRLFCLLQLQQCYDSNYFAGLIYEISTRIRGCKVSDIRPVFDDVLLKTLQSNSTCSEVWNYSQFKNVGIGMDKRFLRYVLVRIEEYIADNTNMEMRHPIYNLVISSGTSNGFHIEHILAENTENYAIFNNDREWFQTERNRLGGLLILKGPDNISSNNEPYCKKLESYANTLYWNETLRKDSYKSKLDFTKWIAKEQLPFRPMDTFGPNEVEERQKLIFELVKRIWVK